METDGAFSNENPELIGQNTENSLDKTETDKQDLMKQNSDTLKGEELFNKLASLYALLNDIQNIQNNREFRQLYGSKKNRFENKRSSPKDVDKKRPGWALAYGK